MVTNRILIGLCESAGGNGPGEAIHWRDFLGYK